MIGLTPSVAVYFTAATGASGSTVAPSKLTVISKAVPVSPLKFTKFTVNSTVLPAAFSVEVNDIVLPSIVTPANSNSLADFGVKSASYALVPSNSRVTVLPKGTFLLLRALALYLTSSAFKDVASAEDALSAGVTSEAYPVRILPLICNA